MTSLKVLVLGTFDNTSSRIIELLRQEQEAFLISIAEEKDMFEDHRHMDFNYKYGTGFRVPQTAVSYTIKSRGPSIKEQSKINAINSQLSRARMSKNKHLIKELEEKLMVMVQNAWS